MADENEVDINDNGHEVTEEEVERAFKGAKITLDDLRKEDGIMAKAAMRSTGAQSVLQRSMTPVDDENYRAIFLTGFTDPIKARLAANAKAELTWLGVPITDLLDNIHAEASVSMGARLLEIYRTITHTSLSTNYQKRPGQNKWWDKNKNGIDQSGITEE